MTPELQDTLAEALEALQQGKDFILREAPAVIQEFIAWKRAEHLVLAAIAALVIVAALLTVRWALRKDDEEELFIIITICSAGFAIGAGIIFCFHAFSALQVWIAPRVYLLEYVASALKH